MTRREELEGVLARLREQLEHVTERLKQAPANTSLVIQRVTVMKRIMVAQSELDRLLALPTG